MEGWLTRPAPPAFKAIVNIALNIRMFASIFLFLPSILYDGASVNSRKNKFKFIFSTVFFTKTAEKNI